MIMNWFIEACQKTIAGKVSNSRKVTRSDVYGIAHEVEHKLGLPLGTLYNCSLRSMCHIKKEGHSLFENLWLY